jgi:hypothetical protein
MKIVFLLHLNSASLPLYEGKARQAWPGEGATQAPYIAAVMSVAGKGR